MNQYQRLKDLREDHDLTQADIAEFYRPQESRSASMRRASK